MERDFQKVEVKESLQGIFIPFWGLLFLGG
jgi:hypothetical protein